MSPLIARTACPPTQMAAPVGRRDGNVGGAVPKRGRAGRAWLVREASVELGDLAGANPAPREREP